MVLALAWLATGQRPVHKRGIERDRGGRVKGNASFKTVALEMMHVQGLEEWTSFLGGGGQHRGDGDGTVQAEGRPWGRREVTRCTRSTGAGWGGWERMLRRGAGRRESLAPRRSCSELSCGTGDFTEGEITNSGFERRFDCNGQDTSGGVGGPKDEPAGRAHVLGRGAVWGRVWGKGGALTVSITVMVF